MALYAIGDVQGCDAELGALLSALKFSADRDSLWFALEAPIASSWSLPILVFAKSSLCEVRRPNRGLPRRPPNASH